MSPDCSRCPRGSRWRTSEEGAIRFNRDFSRIGVGRITNSSRTSDPKEFRRRDDILTKLAESGQIELLRAFKARSLTIEHLVEADREQRLRSADVLALLTLRKPLWSTVDATVEQMGRTAVMRKRYAVSLGALRVKAKLPC